MKINFEDLLIRSNTLDKAKYKNPIKINLNENNAKILLNANNLPRIMPRLSLSNFHKENVYNNNKDLKDLKEINGQNFKLNIFNKTSGVIGFKGITFNKGLTNFRNTNYKINNMNNMNILKPIISFNDTLKYKLIKESLLNKNNNNNNIKIINNNVNNEKESKNSLFNKNIINSKTFLNNKNNPININMNIFKKNIKKMKLEKKENKMELKKKEENELKNNLYEENNDSFINELNNLFPNEKDNNEFQKSNQEQIDINENNNDSDEDKEPDPRINFEQINRVNKSRPQTSYGGLNARRKNLQSALSKNNRLATSNIPE